MAPRNVRPRSGRILTPRRELLYLGIGVACGALVGVVWTTDLMILVGWLVAATLGVSWVWWVGWSMDPADTERLAQEEARSKATDTWLVAAALVSLGAVVDAMERSAGKGSLAVAVVLLSLANVAISGALVNTVFALKYARMYYVDGPDRGGFSFGLDNFEPSYSDFAYLAFTVGMAFAVPEIRPTQRGIRKVVLLHGLLSYVFATGVLAVAISEISSLAQ
jgi:uncharacterized membrane protein